MRFTVPTADDEEMAESIYDAIRRFAELQTRFGVADRRVRRIEYNLEGRRLWAEVGHSHEGEQVFAILETVQKVFLLCSPNRCVYRGEPMRIDARHVFRVLYFESATLAPGEPAE